MRPRRCWFVTPRKRSLTQPHRSRDGRAAARSRKSGTKQPPTHSKIWSAPPCAASSNPPGAAARFPLAAAIHHFEEVNDVKELKEIKDVKDTRHHDSCTWPVPRKSFTSFTSCTSFTSFPRSNHAHHHHAFAQQ